jgi:3-deoxy-manno-octulosonate cytidylyltransferase (CMP-KDO synthetase)
MRVDIVIPARYASSRLPAKPLLKATGIYLIQHVYERAMQARCARNVVIATDDPRIAAAVAGFGGQCVMTRRDHNSGTDRIAEAVLRLDSDVIINLQGDEPEIDPACIDLLPELLTRNNAEMATLATPIHDLTTWNNPNVVKVICDDAGRALYFSRSPIPHVRDGQPNFRGPAMFLQHVGLYAYRREFLMQFAEQPPCSLEQAERLEQLRVLAMGKTIQVGVIAHAGHGVDTLEDYETFRKSRKTVAAKLEAA